MRKKNKKSTQLAVILKRKSDYKQESGLQRKLQLTNQSLILLCWKKWKHDASSIYQTRAKVKDNNIF